MEEAVSKEEHDESGQTQANDVHRTDIGTADHDARAGEIVSVTLNPGTGKARYHSGGPVNPAGIPITIRNGAVYPVARARTRSGITVDPNAKWTCRWSGLSNPMRPPPEPYSPPAVPDGIEPIIGYRQWAVHLVDVQPEWRNVAVLKPLTATQMRVEDDVTPDRVSYTIERRNVAPPPRVHLLSINAQFEWNPGPQEAGCGAFSQARSRMHLVGNPSCTCGFYAYNEQWARRHIFLHWSTQDWKRSWLADTVCGRIKMWGVVSEHEKGYRAQFAEIDGLYYNPSLPPSVYQELLQQYGVQNLGQVPRVSDREIREMP